MAEEYPDELYRGISTTEHITPEGYLMAGAFQFSKYDGCLRNDDGFCELSINWNDDDDSIKLLLEQQKPNKAELQFKVGYCKITKSGMDMLLKTYINDGHFKYERRPIEENLIEDIQPNPYHGNLLMTNKINKHIQKNIQHSLATLAGSIIKR